MPYPLLLLLALPALTMAEVTLEAQRDAGPETAPFELVIEAVQSRPVPDPDFAPIEQGFEILNQQKLSRSSFQGGKSVYTTRWTLRLRPRRAGLLRIPPLVVGYERSPLFQYEAAAEGRTRTVSDSAPALEVTGNLSQSLVYSRAANTFSVKVLYAQALTEAELTEPAVPGVRAIALEEPQHGEEEHQGRLYRTIEQRYVLLAEAPGRYQVGPIEFSGNGPDAPPEGYHLETEPVEFEAMPPPPRAPTPWLPSTEVRLSAHWNEPLEGVRAGDTRTRTMVVEAHGLPADWLPLPSLTPPAGVRFYPQAPRRFQTTDNGMLVSRLEVDYKMLFTQEGETALPGWDVAWWDTVHDRLERAELPDTSLSVGNFMQASDGETPVSDPPTPRSEEKATPRSVASTPWTAWLWAAIALICAGGWTLTRNRLKQAEQRLQKVEATLAQRTQATNQQDYRNEEAEAYRALAHACRQDNPVLAARALIQWAKYAWPSEAIGSFADLELCAQDPTLSYLLRNLEHSLRGADDDPWMGDLLLNQVDRLRRRRQRQVA